MKRIQFLLIVMAMGLMFGCFSTSSLLSDVSTAPSQQSSTISSSISSSSSFSIQSSSSFQFASSSSIAISYGVLTDSRDGQVYKTVVIGSQVWMAQNLNYGTFVMAGSSSTVEQQNNSVVQKWCYNDSASYCNTYGGLYQWHQLMGLSPSCDTMSSLVKSCNPTGQIQGICPVGWHVPSDSERSVLSEYLATSYVNASALMSTSMNGTDLTGFDALAAGCRSSGGFGFLGVYTGFWSSSLFGSQEAESFFLYTGEGGGPYQLAADLTIAMSVRCIRND